MNYSVWVKVRVASASMLLAGLVLQGPASQAHETILYSFKGGNDGKQPWAALTAGADGNFWGTTTLGGGGSCFSGKGCGTIFRLAADGSESVPYAFGGGCDGEEPHANLTADQSGDFYGTTVFGGDCSGSGFGTVFELTAGGTEKIIRAFQGVSVGDGDAPYGPVIFDGSGNLYGTTAGGGISGCGSPGCGTVFKIAPDGTESIIYAFRDGTDGAAPQGGLLSDGAGNFFGTAGAGGNLACNPPDGCGTVFKIASNGTFSALYAFQGGTDGEFPESTLVADGSGNLYGTTFLGGLGYGTVFKLAPGGTETVLYAFKGGNDGRYPYAGVVIDQNDNLYGTTAFGGGGRGCHGEGCGTVFKLTPSGHESIILAFATRAKGTNPNGGLLLENGFLFGTTLKGGAHEAGIVFSVKK